MLFPHKGGVTPWSLRAFSNPGPLGMIKNNILLDIFERRHCIAGTKFHEKSANPG
jgi:hypothetical protein